MHVFAIETPVRQPNGEVDLFRTHFVTDETDEVEATWLALNAAHQWCVNFHRAEADKPTGAWLDGKTHIRRADFMYYDDDGDLKTSTYKFYCQTDAFTMPDYGPFEAAKAREARR